MNYPKKTYRLRRGKAGNPVINKENNQVFETAKEAAEFEDINLYSFYSMLDYKRKYFKYRKLTKQEKDDRDNKSVNRM